MSTFENKVEAVTDFLRNRASLRRLTDYQEVGRVAGELLYSRGQRHIKTPVSREKIAAVLQKVDDTSVADKGFMLSAIVVHFWDNEAGHRFFDQAYERGIYEGDTDPGYRKGLHLSHVEQAFAAYPEFIAVNREPVVPDDVSDLDDLDDEDYAETPEGGGPSY